MNMKRTQQAVIAVIIIVSIMSSGCVLSGNLVKNGDFELGNASWNYNTITRFGFDDAKGSKIVRLLPDSIMYQNVGLEPSTKYTLTFNGRSFSEVGSVIVNVGGDEKRIPVPKSQTMTIEYYYITEIFTTPSVPTNSITFSTPASLNQTIIYMDDVVLKKTSSSLTLSTKPVWNQ